MTLTRPLRVLCLEPLVLFTCLYLSYACKSTVLPILPSLQQRELTRKRINRRDILHIPAILPENLYRHIPFQRRRNRISAAIYLSWDWYLARAQRLQRPWSSNEELRRLPLACIAGPFFVISAFWLGWTSSLSIHWIVPTLAGIRVSVLLHGAAELFGGCV
jgi:hypothetical protein